MGKRKRSEDTDEIIDVVGDNSDDEIEVKLEFEPASEKFDEMSLQLQNQLLLARIDELNEVIRQKNSELEKKPQDLQAKSPAFHVEPEENIHVPKKTCLDQNDSSLFMRTMALFCMKHGLVLRKKNDPYSNQEVESQNKLAN